MPPGLGEGDILDNLEIDMTYDATYTMTLGAGAFRLARSGVMAELKTGHVQTELPKASEIRIEARHSASAESGRDGASMSVRTALRGSRAYRRVRVLSPILGMAAIALTAAAVLAELPALFFVAFVCTMLAAGAYILVTRAVLQAHGISGPDQSFGAADACDLSMPARRITDDCSGSAQIPGTTMWNVEYFKHRQ